MVKPFADAVATLKKGETTQAPVQSQYGWHVIQLIDTRETPVPPLAQVKDRVDQLVQNKKFRAYQDELLKTAKVEKNP
jgi:peptidyl-prolyl cis-trans isomerase C